MFREFRERKTIRERKFVSFVGKKISQLPICKVTFIFANPQHTTPFSPQKISPQKYTLSRGIPTPTPPKFKYRIEQTASTPLPTLSNTHSHCVSTLKNPQKTQKKFHILHCTLCIFLYLCTIKTQKHEQLSNIVLLS